MPASQRSLALTNAYRNRLLDIRWRTERGAIREFPSIDTLDTTEFVSKAARVVARGQIDAVRATAGYLAAYLSSELGRRVPAVALDTRKYAGLSRDGRPLDDALRSPLIGVLAKLKDGADPTEAVAYGRNRALRMVEVDLMHAARAALLDEIDRDDRIEGWQRATAGTCGACMALSGSGGARFEVHPGCQCTPQPVVRGVRDRFPLPTGEQMLEALSRAELVERFGEEKADKLAAGAALADLVERVQLETADDFISEAPAEAL